MRSTHTCYAILTWIKEFTYLDKKRIIQHGNCPRFEHERLKTMANTKTNLPVNSVTSISSVAFEIADHLAIIVNDKQSQSDNSKSAMGKRMDNENTVFNLLVNAGNVSEVWAEVYHNMGFTHEVMVPIHGKNTPVTVEGPNGKAPATLKQYASATKAFQNALETFKPEYNKDNVMTLSAMGACWKAYKEAGKSAEQKEFEAAIETLKKAYRANIKAKNMKTATELSRDLIGLALAYGE
jgi:tetratricopeptide (TPR) repeat protein